MTEILFYHLEQRSLEQVLPLLLEKSLERGWNAIVEVGGDERAKAIDDALWSFRDDSFLPHAIVGGEHDGEQPILITCDKNNPNASNIRFFVDRCMPRVEGDYERLVYMFDGHDPEAVEEARAIWKALKSENELTYWQQGGSGRWMKKA